MAKWNFFVLNTSLIKELDTSGNDVNPQSQSFLAPTLDLQGDKIVFKESGAYKTTLLFTEIGEIDGVNPSDLQDAYDRIIAILPNNGVGGAEVPNITITTSISIDTDTTGSGYGQHGRNTKISNGANAINLTVQTSSNADFIASYTKIGSATITFVAGSGTTLVQLSGTAILNGAVGSTSCLTRNGNVYYLQITNY